MLIPFQPLGKALCTGVKKGLHTVWSHALALTIPNTCMGCHGRLPPTEPLGFCPTCFAHLAWWNPATLLPPRLPAAITTFQAPCLYEGPLRNAILTFKFHDATVLAPPLAKLMAPLVPTHLPLLIVPVPSHPKRLRHRLYNHAALLALQLATLTGQPVNTTALHRTKAGLPQAEKTRAARLRLPGTTFQATQVIKNQNILLIDDILTTGATAHACALALKRAGAKQVHVLTLAYTAPA